MVNDKMVNGFMKNRVNRAFMAKKKKQYISPLFEVSKINLGAAILTGSPTDSTLPPFPHPGTGAPARHNTPVF